MALIWRAKAQIEQYVNRYVKLYVMYVLALSNYKQPAAAAGYKPAPQLGRQIAEIHFVPNKKGSQSLLTNCLTIQSRGDWIRTSDHTPPRRVL